MSCCVLCWSDLPGVLHSVLSVAVAGAHRLTLCFSGKHTGVLWPSLISSETSDETSGETSHPSEPVSSSGRQSVVVHGCCQDRLDVSVRKGFVSSKVICRCGGDVCFNCFVFQEKPLGTGHWVSRPCPVQEMFASLDILPGEGRSGAAGSRLQ